MQYQMEPDNADNYAKHYESFGVYTQFFTSQFACDDAHTELIAYKTLYRQTEAITTGHCNFTSIQRRQC